MLKLFNLRLKIIICFSMCFLVFGLPMISNALERLSLGLYPYLQSTELITMYSPLADYLADRTGIPVDIVVSKDYKTHSYKVGKDELDIAYIGPLAYIKLVKSYGKKPLLARLEINGSPTYHGIIAVRKDSLIYELSGLKGKRFAFGSSYSTMGHMVPRVVLCNEDIEVEDFGKYDFLGNHANVALGILAGDYDAGAINEVTFHKYEKRGLRELAVTEQFSEHLFVVSSKVSPELTDILKNALFDLKNTAEGEKIMRSIKSTMTAMVPVKDSNYDNLREVDKIFKRYVDGLDNDKKIDPEKCLENSSK